MQYYNSYLENGKKNYCFQTIDSIVNLTIALICFQLRYLIHFEISNKIILKGGGGEIIFMFIKGGHGLRKVEKHWFRNNTDRLGNPSLPPKIHSTFNILS
jgi:hypothetical protein